MPLAYDLVIIGATAAGVQAADLAARWGARVVLVEQGMVETAPEAIGDRVLLEVGQTLEQAKRAIQLGVWQTGESGGEVDPAPLWQLTQRWTAAVGSTLEAAQSGAVLATSGVEVISGCGEFCRKPDLGFLVRGRLLRSRAYLLATGGCSVVPEIEGLSVAGYLTPRTLMQQEQLLKRVRNLVVIGADARGTALAQAFARLGIAVTMITTRSQILPGVDPEIASLIQAHLEAIGVGVLTSTAISQIRPIQGKKWVQAGDRAIEADEILLAAGQQPNLAGLNLEAANLDWRADIPINAKLQTRNPRIYACLGQIDGDYAAHVAAHEAAIAVKNALFFPWFTATRQTLPRLVCTNPALAWIGFTEADAMQQYGQEVMILRQRFETIQKAQLRGEPTGLCKLIVRRNGMILGAHLVGAEAGEWIGAIALAIQQKLPIRTLATLSLPSPTFAEVLRNTALEWDRLRLEDNPIQQDFLEWWFATRRSWG
jgi:pyruvate/2-oxoglutarate dehydrogenase complex dihydrolipoamide dehydrogenase (E3) component